MLGKFINGMLILLFTTTPFPPPNHFCAGWGNQKGMISVTKNGTRAPNNYCRWHPDVVAGREPAPHSEDAFNLTFCCTDPDATSYDFYCRVGGGGGHTLHVYDVTATAYCHNLET